MAMLMIIGAALGGVAILAVACEAPRAAAVFGPPAHLLITRA
jgi:hypothetical protein